MHVAEGDIILVASALSMALFRYFKKKGNSSLPTCASQIVYTGGNLVPYKQQERHRIALTYRIAGIFRGGGGGGGKNFMDARICSDPW